MNDTSSDDNADDDYLFLMPEDDSIEVSPACEDLTNQIPGSMPITSSDSGDSASDDALRS